MKDIDLSQCSLGIELGSTRIKAVLIGSDNLPMASGTHDWENRMENGYWTYSLKDVWDGIQDSYADLAKNVMENYGIKITTLGAMGVSAMMHGYMPFDRDGNLLTAFRTWRNTTTGEAAGKLTELFQFNIPQRWSVAHLYQAVLNGESHVENIDFLTTLAGYVHWKLTGEKVLGVGEASGMFPIDSETCDFDDTMLKKFDGLHVLKKDLRDILPAVLTAGTPAGRLTPEGAKLLDPTGTLQGGIPLCPPEGDAGTGMAATDAVSERTGNVSAGTSIFAMIVLEKPLSRYYTEIDMVTTPTGKPVAMVHCNSCTSDLDAWVGLFKEFSQRAGCDVPKSRIYDLLYESALEGEADGGGLVAFNYYSGEPITGLESGRPLFTRLPERGMPLANFMRVQLYSAVSTLKIGMDILFKRENVTMDRLMGHGGFFKTPVVGQRIMAAAAGVPVTVMETAGEGGPYGMALLASYMLHGTDESLEDYLNDRVFADAPRTTIKPIAQDVEGFDKYIEKYSACLPVERAATEALN